MPTAETAPAASTIFLEQIRVIRAPRAQVYAAWTTPEILKQWFGPANFTCPAATLDVREGGSYRIDVKPTPDAPAAAQQHGAHSVHGAYTKVVPNQLLQFTWDPEWNPGELSLVTVTFEDVRGGTQINIRHERFATEQSRDGHNNGWSGCMDKLDAMSAKL